MEDNLQSVEAAGEALFRLGRKFSRFPQREVLSAKQGRGVELSHILVVQAVEARQRLEDEVLIGSVATYLEIDASTASRLVATSQRGGYLTSQPSSVDRRATTLTLTPSGTKLADDAKAFHHSVFEKVTDGWTGEEKRIFIPLFLRFVDQVINALSESQVTFE